MLRTAAAEYALGVKNNKIVNAHEYQDAWGFTQVARRLIQATPPAQIAGNKKQFEAAKGFIKPLGRLWNDLAGKHPVKGDSTMLAVVAARIELEALSIR